MIVGGREFGWNRADVENAMKGKDAEPFREHVVEMLGTVYPPKQVIATVTGWKRTTFTTMEAQRVLTKLGFVCRRAGNLSDGTPAWVHDDGGSDEDDVARRLHSLEVALTTAQEAIASLSRRVGVLESGS